MLKSYQQAYKYLCRFTDYERMARFHYSQKTFNLKRIKRLMKSVGNPQNHCPLIHVAGTKGKGSTAIILARLLEAAGYKIGLFTSPHLVSLRERIQINGRQIPLKAFTRTMNQLYPFLKRHKKSADYSTFFEIMTAAAWLYFFQQKVNLAIMEVGLGGRLDATNIITPLVSVITKIDFDHVDKLGRTLPLIAREKAGIIKKHIPVFCADNAPAALRVIKKIARQKQAPFYQVGRQIKITGLRTKHGSGLLFNVKTTHRHYRQLKLSLAGPHQAQNTALALGVIDHLNNQKVVDLKPVIIKKACPGISLPGRIEVVQRAPYIIIDSAHNPVSIRSLINTIRKTFKYRKLVLILALNRDKETVKILDLILPESQIVILTKANNPRMWDPIDLVPQIPARFFDRPIFLEPKLRTALKLAKTLAGKKDMILSTGSFYLAGEMKSILNR